MQRLVQPRLYEPFEVEVGTPFDYIQAIPANAETTAVQPGTHYRIRTGLARFRLGPFEDPGNHLVNGIWNTLIEQGHKPTYLWLWMKDVRWGPIDGGYPEWIDWECECIIEFEGGPTVRLVEILTLIAIIVIVIGIGITAYAWLRTLHILVPQPIEHHSCEICGQTCFSTEAELVFHISDVHGLTKVPCPYCDRLFDTEEEMQAHVDAVHGGGVPEIPWDLLIIGIIVVVGAPIALYIGSKIFPSRPAY